MYTKLTDHDEFFSDEEFDEKKKIQPTPLERKPEPTSFYNYIVLLNQFESDKKKNKTILTLKKILESKSISFSEIQYEIKKNELENKEILEFIKTQTPKKPIEKKIINLLEFNTIIEDSLTNAKIKSLQTMTLGLNMLYITQMILDLSLILNKLEENKFFPQINQNMKKFFDDQMNNFLQNNKLNQYNDINIQKPQASLSNQNENLQNFHTKKQIEITSEEILRCQNIEEIRIILKKGGIRHNEILDFLWSKLNNQNIKIFNMIQLDSESIEQFKLTKETFDNHKAFYKSRLEFNTKINDIDHMLYACSMKNNETFIREYKDHFLLNIKKEKDEIERQIKQTQKKIHNNRQEINENLNAKEEYEESIKNQNSIMRWFKSNLGEAPKDFDSINSELVKENELLNSRLKINTEYLDRANKLIEIIEKLNQTDQKVFELLSNSTKKFFEKDLKNCYFDILEFSDSKESNNMPEDESEYKKKIQINENDRKFLQKNNKIKNLSNTRAQVIQIVTDFIIKKNNSLSNPDLEQIRDTLKRTSVEPSEILSVLEKKDKNDKINNLIYAIKAEEISLEIFNFFRRRIQIVIDSSKNLSFLISKIIMKKDFEKLSESEKEQIFDQINKELEKYLEIHKQICEIDSDCVIEFYGEDPDNFIHYDENNFDAEKYKKELENKKEQKCKIYKFEDLELPAPNLNIKLEKTEFEKIESFLGN